MQHLLTIYDQLEMSKDWVTCLVPICNLSADGFMSQLIELIDRTVDQLLIMTGLTTKLVRLPTVELYNRCYARLVLYKDLVAFLMIL